MGCDSTVLIVEDDQPLKEALVCTLKDAGYGVLAAGDGGEAMEIIGHSAVDLVITDIQMQPVDGHELLRQLNCERPGLPVLMMTAYGTIEQAVLAMRSGAVDYLVKPFEASQLQETVARYVEREASVTAGDEPIAVDPRSQSLMGLAARVAKSEITVLLTGESGTGKEVVARHIHASSSRSAGPFVAINCAAIPDQMLEALLFGYEKGSFTGAQTKSDGKFVQANGGTLLLDEISEMDLSLQAKLLRVLQEREVEPLGASKPTPLDVRVLATTNRDLEDSVQTGRFREDLYYRLNVFPLHLPALRERPGDIGPLAERFIAGASRAESKPPELSPAAMTRLTNCPWPGNVRQLENVIQRALVLSCASPVLDVDVLVFDGENAPGKAASDLSGVLWAEETRRIVNALESSDGRRKEAAQMLGISPRTLRYKLSKIRGDGVEVPGDRLG